MFKALLKNFSGETEQARRLPGHRAARDLSSTDAGSPSTPRDGERGQSPPILELLTDDELNRLNNLLPWSCFVLDAQGRRFGRPWSATKRSVPQEIPDYRIVELDRRFPLRERDVLEIGCFEGVHTAALTRLARRVMAADSRVENVVKTIVRCAVLGVRPVVFPWNVEDGPVRGIDISCDVLHHVGVLYHLVDPVRHLRDILPHVRHVVMLDTHVASTDTRLDSYMSGAECFRYQRYKEGGREEPFAGMADHAKWLVEEDLVRLLREMGFATVDVAERRAERNGPRVLIYAAREDLQAQSSHGASGETR